MNHFIRFCFSNGSAHIFSKRFITTLRRKYPIQSPSMLWTEGYMPPLTVREQVYEEVPSDTPPNSSLNVLLTSDVPGLGSKGSVVSVHRNRFWRYLHILGLAELPTPERIAYFQAQSTDTLVLSGDSYESEQRLRSMTLYIPMNPTKDWTLDKTHVKVAFRKYGIQLDEDCITLPEEPITRDSPSLLFNVYIKIDGIADVPVPCRIFLYQRLDKVTCTQPPSNVFKTITVDDWSADFPESDAMSARMTHRFLSNGRRVSEHLFRLQRCKDNAVSLFESVPLSATNQSALTHFDKFYPKVYGPLGWSTMRAALLCPSGKAFLLNRFSSRFGELWTKGVGAYKLDLIRTLAKHQSVWNAPQSVMDSTVPEEQKSPEMNRLVQPQFLSQMGTHSATSNMNLSEFVPATALISETELFTRECDLDVTFTVANPNIEGGLQWISEDWKLPDRLCVMCSKFGRIPGYRSPKFLDGQFDFYPLDLGSLVPVLSLNLQRDDTLLDLCAAPGGKALAALQTGLPRLLICLDNSSSRLLRLQEVIATHSSQASPIDPIVHVLHETELGRFLSSDLPPEDRLFSKILVDVPCSADRHALTSDKGSVFSRGRSKERLGLPTTQTRLLLRAMNLCRPEGSVVYSTCTLSPAQNQAIVESCLSKVDGKAQFAVVDLTPLVKAFELVQSELGLRLVPIYGNQWQRNPLGVLVVPSIAANYGPTFVSKLKRIA